MTTPTGVLGGPVAGVAAMLSNSSTFQTWSDSDDATEALTHVHYCIVPNDDVEHPLCIVDFGRRQSAQGLSYGASTIRTWQNEVHIFFEGDTDSGDDDAEAMIKFMNTIGGILVDLWDLSSVNDNPVFMEMDCEYGPAITYGADANSEQRRVQIAFTVLTGTGAA